MRTKPTGKPGIRNGRTARIHAYLRQSAEPLTVREICNAIDPEGAIDPTNTALIRMSKCGYVDKIGHGKGNVRYRLGAVALPGAKHEATHVTAPAVPASQRLDTTPPKPLRTNFQLAPAATSIPEANVANSARIAADIAAFEARGGRIQRLGVTQLFRQSRAAND
ncbi:MULTISPECIES: hypothetical protein [Luteimonas]|uniref:hypothetical protein n=1 Tax=Luteimonas TaxID=83614 RepID=UPI000C7E5D63|nr:MULTISPECIES: hypothetical protein [Luteimonas]